MMGNSTFWPKNIPVPEERKYTISGRVCDSVIYGKDSSEILRAYILK